MTPSKIKYTIFIIIFLLTTHHSPLTTASAFAEQVKKADLAGSWYPSDKDELSAMLDGFLKNADTPQIDARPIALISPHAGFVFSGPVAAYGYKVLEGKQIKTVIVLGFSHRQYYDGISVYNTGKFQTPLGNLKVDEELALLFISRSERIRFYPEIFTSENSIETQLPFIKMVLPDAKIVPVAFGNPNLGDCGIVADILTEVLAERDDVVVVASSDMSHFKDYQTANVIDAATIELMKGFNYREIFKKGASVEQPCCGYAPVTCVLMLAERLGAENFKVLKYANSGDTFGDKSRVVGYLSAVILKKEYREQSTDNRKEDKQMQILNQKQRERLLEIARQSMTAYVTEAKRVDFKEEDPTLNRPMGAFVTLHKAGELRGCIGNIIGRGPLYQTVADMAIEAAVGDPRFRPVTPKELDSIDVEVSVLSELKRVNDISEINIPGHGVLVRTALRSGVYLPQVARETGWNKEEFLTSLCASKAGLPPDAWKDKNTELYIFSAEVFGEEQ